MDPSHNMRNYRGQVNIYSGKSVFVTCLVASVWKVKIGDTCNSTSPLS